MLSLDVLAELVVINQHSQHLLKGQHRDQGVQVFVPVKLECSLVQCYSDEVTSHHKLVDAAHRYTNRVALDISLHRIFSRGVVLVLERETRQSGVEGGEERRRES